MAKINYDEEPVYYCKRCLSLNIQEMPMIAGGLYCGECGASETAQTQIEEWDRMYKERYGREFIVKQPPPKWPYWC